MDMLQKLMQEKMKKGGSDEAMDPKKKAAMMGVLDHISHMAEGAMGDDMKHELDQQVTVAAPDRKGLKSGLDMASKLVDKKGAPLHSDDFDENPDSEEQHHEMEQGEMNDQHEMPPHSDDEEEEEEGE